MSWLARLEIVADIVRQEKITDNYRWHKKLWECFPEDPDAKRDFLTRVDQLDGSFRLWVMGKRKPVQPQWCPDGRFSLKEIVPSFLTHRFYTFDLKANPVKTLVQRGTDGQPLFRANGKRKSGKRVPIVNDAELREWLVRKGNARCRDQETGEIISGGFRIVEEKPLEISPMNESFFRKKDKETGRTQAAYHGGVQFRGVLEVTDSQKFIETYRAGIGSAKSFGFGLFLLAPIKL